MTLTPASEITRGDTVRLGMHAETVRKVGKRKTPGGMMRVTVNGRTYSADTLLERL